MKLYHAAKSSSLLIYLVDKYIFVSTWKPYKHISTNNKINNDCLQGDSSIDDIDSTPQVI